MQFPWPAPELEPELGPERQPRRHARRSLLPTREHLGVALAAPAEQARAVRSCPPKRLPDRRQSRPILQRAPPPGWLRHIPPRRARERALSDAADPKRIPRRPQAWTSRDAPSRSLARMEPRPLPRPKPLPLLRAVSGRLRQPRFPAIPPPAGQHQASAFPTW